MLASRKGSYDIVKLLVENGADLMATNKVYTEIYNIALVCVVNVVELLILVFFDCFILFRFQFERAMRMPSRLRRT